MSILEPTTLPLELIERIIDETFYSQLPASPGSENIWWIPQALSSLACVSHIFRQCVNTHRFATVSFNRTDLKIPYIHAFRDLLRSDLWAASSMGIARRVRKLELILGGKDERGYIIPNRAVDDGSFAEIMNTIFHAQADDPHTTESDPTLALWGYTEGQKDILLQDPAWLSWPALHPDFRANIERLLDSCVLRLELTWFGVVSPTVLKRRHVKCLCLSDVSTRLTPQSMEEFDALGPWNHLESLDIHNMCFYDFIGPETLPMLRTLKVTLLDDATADLLSACWQHWNALEDLTLRLDNDYIFPRFRIDYRNLFNLRRLTLNLQLMDYKSSPSAIESSTHQILSLLGPDLPHLTRLEIRIDSTLRGLPRYQDIGLINDIPTQFHCTALDAVLAQHPPSAISTIALQFGIALSRGVGDDLELEAFREAGLDVLREAFPRLNGGPRRRVYDSVVSKKWKDRERANALLHEGLFCVEYTQLEVLGKVGGVHTLRARV